MSKITLANSLVKKIFACLLLMFRIRIWGIFNLKTQNKTRRQIMMEVSHLEKPRLT